MPPITTLHFDNTYARLPDVFFERVTPAPLSNPHLVAFNPEAARLIGLEAEDPTDPEVVAYLSGNRPMPGSEPIAMAYAGHQFGTFVPQLGDGRAILLGEVRYGSEKWDLHLKGGGKTKFSRFGDGRAVLRSTIREYLCSEAMHGLGIPTTRALSIVGSDVPVRRELVERAATLVRMAPSHVRFGSFELLAARGFAKEIGVLADYMIREHFPHLAQEPDQYAKFLSEVVARTATLIAHWMAAGFSHGVMNTDNMSILGITLDYGPFGFLEATDLGYICNHSDHEGRYAFDQQPAVALWNLSRFAESLLSLISREEALAALEQYQGIFEQSYAGRMRDKLGLREKGDDDGELVGELLTLLQRTHADYSMFFRALGDFDPGQPVQSDTLLALIEEDPTWEDWTKRYAGRLAREGSVVRERNKAMHGVNPKYILRNYLAQEAIAKAEQEDDYSEIERLRLALSDPYSSRPEFDRYAASPPSWSRELVVSCSS